MVLELNFVHSSANIAALFKPPVLSGCEKKFIVREVVIPKPATRAKL